MLSKIRALPKRLKVLTGVAALLIVGAVLPLTTAAAAPPVPFDAGYLRLHMSTDGSSFRQYDNGNNVIATQLFSAGSKCNYIRGTGSTNANLMVPGAPIPPNAAGSVPSYLQKDNGYGLGVNKAGKEGTVAVQTNLTEKFTLELQNDGSPSSLAGLYVSSTNLDMEYKFNATLSAAFFKDGQPVGTALYPVPASRSSLIAVPTPVAGTTSAPTSSHRTVVYGTRWS